MPKIQAQTGMSLADTYDIVGSVAGVENLESRDVHLFDEMGARVHSERLNVFNLIANSGVIAQSTSWDISLGGFPDSVNRLLSITVLTDVDARIDNCQISINDQSTLGADHPIWVWDTLDDVQSNIRWGDGAALQTFVVLRPTVPMPGIPTIIARTGAAALMPLLTFRGISSAFGAGTVQALALIQIGRPNVGNPSPGSASSYGLPIPSW